MVAHALAFATRPSALARWQTNWVRDALQTKHVGLQYTEILITTQGDRTLDKPLPEIGGKGLFTQELERELYEKRVQAAVHSLKDLPVENPPGLVLGAIPQRGEVRDALVSARGYSLETLPKGGRVGTSSLRRAAQLLSIRPDLNIEPLRGNVDTRIKKAKQGVYDAILLAGAGLERLGFTQHISQWLSLEEMLPAPGQGALAVQCRADDLPTLELLSNIEHPATRQAVTAERAFLHGLGGGCSVPVAAFAEQAGDQLRLHGRVISLDGHSIIDCHETGSDPIQVGTLCAQQALAMGAAELLAHIFTN